MGHKFAAEETHSQVKWILEQHRITNHMYDNYLPYEFHLRMVRMAGDEHRAFFDGRGYWEPVVYALYGHDLIEDTRTSYNDCVAQLGKLAADIIYAVTNEKGKTRSERANDKYYEGIRNVDHGLAIFVKICDRIANVRYSKMMGSSMFNKYKSENQHFILALDFNKHFFPDKPLYPVFNTLMKLFED